MRYKADLEPALQGCTFKIKSGERIAIVGRTGSGKSSLMQLLEGFRYPSEGHVLVGSHSISDYSLQKLRKQIKIVL